MGGGFNRSFNIRSQFMQSTPVLSLSDRQLLAERLGLDLQPNPL